MAILAWIAPFAMVGKQVYLFLGLALISAAVGFLINGLLGVSSFTVCYGFAGPLFIWNVFIQAHAMMSSFSFKDLAGGAFRMLALLVVCVLACRAGGWLALWIRKKLGWRVEPESVI